MKFGFRLFLSSMYFTDYLLGHFTLFISFFYRNNWNVERWTMNTKKQQRVEEHLLLQKSWQKFTYPCSTLNQSAYWLKKNASDALHPQNSGVIGWSHLHCWWHSVIEFFFKVFQFYVQEMSKMSFIGSMFLHVLTRLVQCTKSKIAIAK